jgi:hypothetical protein
MSKRYTSDGKRRSSQTHASRTHRCSCGRTVSGNGGKWSHRRACPAGRWLTTTEAYAARATETAGYGDEEACRCPLGAAEPHTVADHKANVCRGFRGERRCGTCWNCRAEDDR